MGFLGSITKSIGGAFTPSLPSLGSDLTGSLIGGNVADLIPGIGDARAQDKANKANLNEAALNRAFQERMANTAYQRAMEDMRKAGLNPTLAYIQGGAATPSGGTATVQSASKTGLADMALKAATGIGGLSQQATALQQQQAMNNSSIQLNASQAMKNAADADRTRAETIRTRAETTALGKKEAEGNLWNRFYKGVNNLLDTSAKNVQDQQKTHNERKVKVLEKFPALKGSMSGPFKLP